jgi:hypothetical protein
MRAALCILALATALTGCDDETSMLLPDLSTTPLSDGGLPVDFAQFVCGEHVCGPGQVCIHPCCGGAAPTCHPLPDGGRCDVNEMYLSSCAAPGVGGCIPFNCVPPPAFCANVSAPCACPSGSSCLPASASGDVSCLCP